MMNARGEARLFLTTMIVALVMGAGIGVAEEPFVEKVLTIEPPLDVTSFEVADLDGDGTDEILLISRKGEVRSYHRDAKSGKLEKAPRGTLVLPDPEHSLYARADILGTGDAPQLVVASPAGIEVYPIGPDGTYAATSVVIAPRARNRIRVGRPTSVEFTQDVNGDGRPDFILPGDRRTELWLAGKMREATDSAPARPAYRKAASVVVDVSRSNVTSGRALTDRLSSQLSIPRLAIEDVNGDGREDLRVSKSDLRSFHLQSSDGIIAAQPDVTVDLNIFKDTTPKAKIRLGETVAGSDDTGFYNQDLNDDGIPDYVIWHRRKVWVFHGTSEGPQFSRPSSILKVAEDISQLVVVPIDPDPYPDLLLFKLELPGVATLMRGLVADWDVSLTAIAYAGTEGRSFEKEPRDRSELTVRLPSILSLLRNPEDLLERVEEASKKFRSTIKGDFDGSGSSDVALVSEDFEKIEIWLTGPEEQSDEDARRELGEMLQNILFGEGSRVWNLDRIIGLISGFGNERTATLTGSRDADLSTSLRTDKEHFRDSLDRGDIDGDGQSEILVTYRRVSDEALVIDVLELRGGK